MTRSRRHLAISPFLLGAVVLLTVACSGDGGGCSGLSPLPNGRYEGPKTDNAVTVRVSPHGVNYLNQNWASLVEMFAPGQTLTFPVGCLIQNVTAVGDLVIGDQGRTSANGTPCSGEGCGQMDGRCCTTASGPSSGCSSAIIDTPQNIQIKVVGFSLVPQGPDRLRAAVSVEIDTSRLYISSAYGTYCDGFPFYQNQPTRNRGVCGCASPMKCSLRFNTALADDGFDINTLSAQIRFTIDTRWDKLLSFEVVQLDGAQQCGSGAPAQPQCLDTDDLQFGGENTCGSGWCGLANIGFVKDFVFGLLEPQLRQAVDDALAVQTCMACGDGLPACPTVDGATSTCQNGTCFDSANGRCVPRFLGIEGRLSPGMLLSGFGVPLSSQLDLSVAAGSSVSVDQGINLGTRAGIQAVEVASCVPAFPAPQLQPMSAPNFDAEAPAGGYHVGLGIASSFLDLAMHHAHQSGTMCIGMSSANFGILNTGLFKTFLPSLGRLATRDGKDAPMMIALRPGKVPSLAIGEGTFDPVTKKPVKPLVTLGMPDLTIDFYAMIDDRFVRLFSLTADVHIPLSLIFEDCSSVTPALGDLNQLITNVRTANSEMLAEDPKVLADLIPAVIGLAEPALAGALQPFELPSLGAFKLKVNATKGLTRIAGTDRYEHLGLFAELLDGAAQCSTAAPKAMARLVGSQIPSGEQMRLRGQPLTWPTAILRVDTQGAIGTAEYAWRVDGGVWSTFLAPSSGGELHVSHPRFLLQGRHVIEVRARLAENPHGASEPVPVDFVVDYEPPEVSITQDRQAGVLHVTARDFVTSQERLQFAYRVGDEPQTAFGPARVIDLEAVEAQGGLEVLVRDEQGHVGRAMWRAPVIALRPDEDAASVGTAPAFPGAQDGGGCSSGGGGLALGGVLTLLAGLRSTRPRRQNDHPRHIS